MTLSSVAFQNFTVFEDATFDLCPGINVLIGANATGKTHAMKAMYAMLRAIDKGLYDTFWTKVSEVFRRQRDEQAYTDAVALHPLA